MKDITISISWKYLLIGGLPTSRSNSSELRFVKNSEVTHHEDNKIL